MAKTFANDRIRQQGSKGMAVLVLLIASSALSILVSAMAHSGEESPTIRDVSWTVKLQARLKDAPVVEPKQSGMLDVELPSPEEYATMHCKNVSETYATLLDHNLRHWTSTGLTGLDDHNLTAQYIYIADNELYMRRGADRRGLLPAFFNLLKQLRLKAKLPDMTLPFNSGDNPNQPLEQHNPSDPVAPLPVLSFCSRPTHTDILFPNVLEGDVGRRDDAPKYATHRLHRAVWRGTTDAFQGWSKGRNALLQLGLERPELIDSGVSRWSAELMNQTLPDKRFMKESLTFEEQVAMYKFLVWAPGNCASVRLALQLASDAAVFKIDNDESEWYYPLLKPFVHYIPLEANNTHVNLEDMMYWARHHQDEVAAMILEANAFTELYLSPLGRNCYAMQLIQRMYGLMLSTPVLPQLVVNVTECDPLDHCPEPPLYDVDPGDEALLDDDDQMNTIDTYS